MTRHARRLALSLVLAPLPLTGCPSEKTAATNRPELAQPDRELTLPGQAFMKAYPNGLTLFVVPDKLTSIVQFDVRQQVGSRDDPDGKDGMAHFVEHLMFQIPSDGEGSAKLMTDIQRHALTFNAYTSSDETHYMHTGTAGELEHYMRYTAKRLAYDCDSVSKEAFERERDVVRNEHRWRGENVDAGVRDAVLGIAFPEGHPYRGSTFATDENTASITPDDACKFIRRHYNAGQATVVVTGDVEPQAVLALADQYLMTLPAVKTQARDAVPDVDVKAGTHEIEAPVKKPTAVVLFQTPKRFTADYMASQAAIQNMFLAVSFFVGGRGSAVENWYPAGFGGKEGQVFGFAVETKNAAQLDRAVDEVLDAVNRAFDSDLKGKDHEGSIDVARQQARVQIVGQIATVESRAGAYADYLEERPKPGFYGTELAALDNLSPEHAQKVGRRVFDRGSALVIKVVPDGSEEGAQAERASFDYEPNEDEQLSVPDDVDPAEANRALDYDAQVADMKSVEFTMDNGMHAILVQSSDVPLMQVEVIVGAGSTDTPENPDLASLAVRSFGASDARDARTLMNYFQMAGGRQGGYAGAFSSVYTARGLSIYLDFLIAGLSESVVNAQYRSRALEGWKERRRGMLKKEFHRQRFSRQNTYYEQIFGEGHPNVRRVITDNKDLRDVTLEQLEEFRANHFRAANSTLVITGGFDLAMARDYVTRFFGEPELRDRKSPWNEPKVGAERPAPVAPKPGEHRFITELDAERVQTQLTIGFPLTEVYGEDHAALTVLGQMLNFAVSSVRHELGSSYGVYARVDPNRPMIEIGGALDSARAGEAVAAIRAELQKLRDGEEFDKLFAFSRREALNDMVQARGDARRLAQSIARAIQAGQDYDYYDDLARNVARLEPSAVKRLIDEHLVDARSVTMIQAPQVGLDSVDAALKIENPLVLPEVVHDEDD